MKKSSLLLALLGCAACSKVSPIDGADRTFNIFSFQLLNGETSTDYFSRPGVLPPDSMVLKYLFTNNNAEYPLPFTQVGGRVYFKALSLQQQPTQPDGTTVNTLLLQLGKHTKPDTVRLVSAPWTRRAVDKSGRQDDYPTRFTFYFNRRLAADFDFLGTSKDSLMNFYEPLHGQIIRLRKK